MNLDYLIGTSVTNLKKDIGNVTEVTYVDNIIRIKVQFDSGREASFNFCNNNNYITKFLTFKDETILNRLTSDIEDDKKIKEETKTVAHKAKTPLPVFTDMNGEKIIRFGKGKEAYGEFSNFNGPLNYDGRHYKCSEGAWQSMKTLDPEERGEFSSLSGTAAKRKGRGVNLRPDWEMVKYNLMVDICYEKFRQNEPYKKLLLGTGDATIVEDTTGWHDNYWGSCSCPKCINIPGQNHLGMALMEVRNRLREEDK